MAQVSVRTWFVSRTNEIQMKRFAVPEFASDERGPDAGRQAIGRR